MSRTKVQKTIDNDIPWTDLIIKPEEVKFICTFKAWTKHRKCLSCPGYKEGCIIDTMLRNKNLPVLRKGDEVTISIDRSIV